MSVRHNDNFKFADFKIVSAINIAKRFIQQNSKFTGVSDTSVLKIFRASGMKIYQRPDFCNWDVRNENQIYNGFEVENTDIYLHLDSMGVYRAGGLAIVSVNVEGIG
ncbi:MAG: hypothetical protein GZ094_17395 [Mariniphaga sp.]|nr:hypothetical protein [Mariniphaga sp.]